MLDTINASLRGLHGVPAVSRHRKAEPVRLVACDPNEIGAQELVQLDEIIAELLLPPNCAAGFLLVTHDYVAADRGSCRAPSRSSGPVSRGHLEKLQSWRRS